MAVMTRVLSTSTILPENANHDGDVIRRLELTPSDLMCLPLDYIHVGLLFNKPKESPVEHLKASLSQALGQLYPFAGRLVSTLHDGDVKTMSFHVECNGAGVKFIHAEAVDGFTAVDILDVTVVPTELVDCLYPMIGVLSNQAADSDLPLLAVQVTEFTDGVFLALSMNHSIADGMTFYQFFKFWSELARGDSTAASRQGSFVFSREFFDDLPYRIPFRANEAPLRLVQPEPLQERILRFSKANIAELKAKVNTGTDRKISSFQAVLAHLWVCITRCRALKADEIVCYMIAIDMRTRLQPPLGQSYMGNAIAAPMVISTVGELLGRGTGWAARQINETITANGRMETRKFYDDCAKNIISSTEEALRTRPNPLLVGGSPQFNAHGNNFGWGRPLVQRRGLATANNFFLNACPGPEEGSIDFEFASTGGFFKVLMGDPEFRQYSS